MPPFKKNQPAFQFTKKQAEDAYKIARVRIHIERAIERMKRFRFLDFVQPQMKQFFDPGLVVISGVCNRSTTLQLF